MKIKTHSYEYKNYKSTYKKQFLIKSLSSQDHILFFKHNCLKGLKKIKLKSSLLENNCEFKAISIKSYKRLFSLFGFGPIGLVVVKKTSNIDKIIKLTNCLSLRFIGQIYNKQFSSNIKNCQLLFQNQKNFYHVLKNVPTIFCKTTTMAIVT